MKNKPKNRYYSNRVLMEQTPLKDGKRDTIVQWIYDIHVVEWYSTYLLRLPLKRIEDKVQEIYVEICSIPQSKWNELYNQGKIAIADYVTGIVHQQLISNTSKVYKKYNKHEQRELTQDELFWSNYENSK